MKGYIKLRKRAFEMLKTQLPENLYYHGFNHTKNILKVVNQYIQREDINDYQAKLLRLATIMHDIGFVKTYQNHEEVGVEIATQLMNDLSFSEQDIDEVSGMIMATRIPQKPHNKLEQIICDADLDYLGRNDFYPISNLLFRELKERDLIANKKDWNQKQVQFLEAHQYHTDYAKKNRQPKKRLRIKELKEQVY